MGPISQINRELNFLESNSLHLRDALLDQEGSERSLVEALIQSGAQLNEATADLSAIVNDDIPVEGVSAKEDQLFRARESLHQLLEYLAILDQSDEVEGSSVELLETLGLTEQGLDKAEQELGRQLDAEGRQSVAERLGDDTGAFRLPGRTWDRVADGLNRLRGKQGEFAEAVSKRVLEIGEVDAGRYSLEHIAGRGRLLRQTGRVISLPPLPVQRAVVASQIEDFIATWYKEGAGNESESFTYNHFWKTGSFSGLNVSLEKVDGRWRVPDIGKRFVAPPRWENGKLVELPQDAQEQLKSLVEKLIVESYQVAAVQSGRSIADMPPATMLGSIGHQTSKSSLPHLEISRRVYYASQENTQVRSRDYYDDSRLMVTASFGADSSALTNWYTTDQNSPPRLGESIKQRSKSKHAVPRKATCTTTLIKVVLVDSSRLVGIWEI